MWGDVSLLDHFLSLRMNSRRENTSKWVALMVGFRVCVCTAVSRFIVGWRLTHAIGRELLNSSGWDGKRRHIQEGRLGVWVHVVLFPQGWTIFFWPSIRGGSKQMWLVVLVTALSIARRIRTHYAISHHQYWDQYYIESILIPCSIFSKLVCLKCDSIYYKILNQTWR